VYHRKIGRPQCDLVPPWEVPGCCSKAGLLCWEVDIKGPLKAPASCPTSGLASNLFICSRVAKLWFMESVRIGLSYKER